MRILFVSPRQARPSTSGAKIRDYQLARALGRAHALTYVYFADPQSRAAGPADWAFCETVIGVPRPPLYTATKLVQGAMGRWPLPVVNYLSREMSETIGRLSRGGRFDLIHLESIHMAGYTPVLASAFPRVPVVYDWHNIESELMSRYGAGAGSLPKRLYAEMTARRMGRLERSILHTAFGHILCSERDRDQLLRVAPHARMAVVPNGVDPGAFDATARSTAERRKIVFTGLMSYHANIESAVWFSRQIWPEIRARFPQWTLTLVGSNPVPEVVSLGDLPGVEVTGTVEDVRPYYQQALAAIVPLRIGGGTRLKILEAMAAGVPVVSTTLGAEGLAVVPGEHLLIADKDEDWLRRLSALAHRDALSRRLTDAGRELVRAHYDWEVLGGALCEIYARWGNSAQGGSPTQNA